MILLDVYSQEQNRYYRVTFHQAGHVLDFMRRTKKRDVERDASGFRVYHVFEMAEETEFEPGDPDEARLFDLLFPQCHHGLSLDLCMDPFGPHHFGTIEQELMGVL